MHRRQRLNLSLKLQRWFTADETLTEHLFHTTPYASMGAPSSTNPSAPFSAAPDLESVPPSLCLSSCSSTTARGRTTVPSGLTLVTASQPLLPASNLLLVYSPHTSQSLTRSCQAGPTISYLKAHKGPYCTQTETRMPVPGLQAPLGPAPARLSDCALLCPPQGPPLLDGCSFL